MNPIEANHKSLFAMGIAVFAVKRVIIHNRSAPKIKRPLPTARGESPSGPSAWAVPVVPKKMPERMRDPYRLFNGLTDHPCCNVIRNWNSWA